MRSEDYSNEKIKSIKFPWEAYQNICIKYATEFLKQKETKQKS